MAKLKPYTYPSNTIVDLVVSEQGDTLPGIPFGNWLLITGRPGTCKTTLAAQLINGLARDPNTIVYHYDYEMGDYKLTQLYERLEITHIDSRIDEPVDLDNVFEQADTLANKNTNLVVLIDSFQFLLNRISDQDEQRKLARKIRENVHKRRNLLIITVNHLTKSGAINGVAEIQQLCDSILLLTKSNGFIYLTSPKNRNPAPNAPDYLKLLATEQGLVTSIEPEFVTNNALIQWGRSMMAKLK